MYVEVINGFCDAAAGDVYPGHRFEMEDRRAAEAVRIGRVLPVLREPPIEQPPVKAMPTPRPKKKEKQS